MSKREGILVTIPLKCNPSFVESISRECGRLCVFGVDPFVIGRGKSFRKAIDNRLAIRMIRKP